MTIGRIVFCVLCFLLEPIFYECQRLWDNSLLSQQARLCSYTDPETGFQATWHTNCSGYVNFVINFMNFPRPELEGSNFMQPSPLEQNFWTGIGFKLLFSWDMALIENYNGFVKISPAKFISGLPPQKDFTNGLLRNTNGQFFGSALEATFSISEAILSGCKEWTFFTRPTRIGSAYSSQFGSRIICNVSDMCRRTDCSMGSEKWYFDPFFYDYTLAPKFDQGNTYFANGGRLYGNDAYQMMPPQQSKEPLYQPYGYAYTDIQIPVIPMQFYPQQSTDPQIPLSNFKTGSLGYSLTTSNPYLLTQLNQYYQPTSPLAPSYTASQPSPMQGIQSPVRPSAFDWSNSIVNKIDRNMLLYASPLSQSPSYRTPLIASGIRRRKRQLISPRRDFVSGSLKGTAYEGQDTPFLRQPVDYNQYSSRNLNPQYNYYDQLQAGTLNFNTPSGQLINSNQPKMYYPYRTPVENDNLFEPARQELATPSQNSYQAQFVQTPSTNKWEQQQQQQQQRFSDLSPQYRGICDSVDPDWCFDYVNEWKGSFQERNLNIQQVCQAIQYLLKNSDHRCCKTLERLGC